MPYDSSVFIGGFQTSKFYEDEFNALGIYSPNYRMKELVFKTSQGTLENIDPVQNGFLSLTNLKVGKVSISVFKNADTGLQLLNKRVFKVVKKPLSKEERNTAKLSFKPHITISGYTDSIPKSVLREATKVEVNEPFKIVELVFNLFPRKGTVCLFEIEVLHSGEFNEQLKRSLKRITANNELGILIDNIRVSDFRGKIYALRKVGFKVID